ncbi:MAG: putative Ig domain-containing protein, partial [Acidobacteria bacterium]|nr:putative Ig domain-containing protein [Acidobacteriota bacterium]
MKTIHQFKFKPIQFITISGLLLSVCLAALLLRPSAPATLSNNTLHGAAAVEQLKQDGSYDSLNAALNATRYQVNQTGSAWRAENPAQRLRAQFTPTEVRMTETQSSKPQWQFGMRLSGYGYGDQLAPVSAGTLTSNGSRVEIRKTQISNSKSEITEWYVNDPAGLEQGFTLAAPPSPISNLKSPMPLRLALQLSGDLRAASANQQAITLKDKQGRAVLSYDHLAAWDAKHQALPATMRADGDTLTLEVDASHAVYPITIDPLIAQQAKFTAADGAAGDKFGTSVAVSGDYAIVGAPEDDAQRGSAYVFVRSGSSWTQQAKLIAVDGVAADRFGISVSISGPTAVIGASGADSEGNVNHGAAYVFVRSGSSWSQQAKLAVSDGSQVSSFGFSVAVSGDTALIGTPAYGLGGETSRGAAYVYARAGVTWSVQQKLLANDGAIGDNFGTSVALDGDTALLGALAANINAASDQGAAYVFTRSGATWNQQAKLFANDGASNDQFGGTVALSADTAVIGSRLSDVGGHSNEGAAYVFVRSGAVWSLQQKLVAADGGDGDAFGVSVTVSGDLIAVGSDDYDLVGYQNQGSVYLFTRNGGVWNQQQKLRAADGAEYDHLGKAVAISGNTIVGGAPQADVNGSTDQGAAYAFIVVNDVAQAQKIFDAGGKLNAEFGNSVAISGDTAVVGAHFDTIGAIFPGSVYVFIRNGATWTLQQKLTPADGASNDQFGIRVAVSGDTLVIGAPFKANGAATEQGAAYVFVRNNGVWSQQQKLLANDGAANDRFGFAVAINGDTALIGAPADQIGAISNQGSVYAFTRSGANWSQQQKLTAADGAAGDYFGEAIAMSGYAAIIGAPFDTINGVASRGSAYVFNNGGGVTWSQQQKLTASDGAANHNFGYAVALDGPTALVGAYGNGGGAAYVFAYNGSTWNQQQELFPSDPVAGNLFGAAVALSGELASIGAPNYDTAQNQDQGAAYLFERQGNVWNQRQKLLASDAAAGDKFGQAIAMTGSDILVGAPSDDIAQNNQGSVYYFRYTVCSTIILNATPPNGTVGTSYNQQLSATGGVGPYQYALSSGTLPPGLSLTQSGLLAGTPMTPGTFNFTVTAMTASLCSGSQAYTVTIAPNCQTITLNPVSLPTGTVGTAYNQPLSAQGGTAPYTFSLNPGDSLPPGLSLINGAIVGGAQQSGTFNFIIKATDAQGCLGMRAYSFTATCQTLNVFPASLPAMTVGVPFNQGLSASGSDGPYTYTLGGGALPGGITLSTGGLLSGTPMTSGNGSFTVNAADVYGCATPKQYNFTANCGTLTITPASLPDGATDVAYNRQLSTTGGNGTYTYSLPINVLPPPGLTLSPSGSLSGTPTQAGQFNLTVNVASGGCTGQQSYTLTITQTCGTLTLNPPSLLNGTVGTNINVQFTTTGAQGAVDYAVTAGALPTGLTLTPAGLLSGAPTQTGVANFTVTATDANGCTGQHSYIMTITIACPTITLTPATVPNGQVNAFYTQQFIASGAGPYFYTISAGALPNGVVLSTTGIASGTPTTSGQFNFTVSAADANGCTGTKQYTLAILTGCPAINLSPAILPNGQLNVAYNLTITASGGAMPYSYGISSGALPSGLTLSTAGVLSGTPTASGQFTFTLTVTDANGCTVQINHGIAITACPTINVVPAPPSPAFIGVAYNHTFSATGGVAPYTYSIIGGALLDGLTLSPAGVISGTPTGIGGSGSAFDVKATDANGCLGQASFGMSLNSCPSITVNPATLPAGTTGTAYNQTITASGGTGPYSYTVSVGSLPPGLNLSAAGALTGTPALNGSYPFTVKATAANGCTGTRAYTLVINCVTITVNPATLPAGVMGTAYSQQLTQTGGTGAITWSIGPGGSLPNGVTLNPNTGLLEGTPTASGTFNFTAVATDANSCGGVRAYTFTVNSGSCPTITVNPATLPNATASVNYNQQLTASGGAGTYTYALQQGNLPAGFNLTAAGVLSGITNVNGTYNFTVKATDANNCTGTRAYTLTVGCAALTVNPASLPVAVAGVTFNQTLTQTGGTGAIAWSVSAGVLPAGWTLNAGTGQ